MIQLTDKVWAVEMPDKVNDFKSFVECVKNDEADTDVGKFQFLFATKTAIEEEARKAVDEHKIRGNVRYEDYTREYMWQETALESLHSLLRSKGLDPNKNYAIIEKQTANGTK